MEIPGTLSACDMFSLLESDERFCCADKESLLLRNGTNSAFKSSTQISKQLPVVDLKKYPSGKFLMMVSIN